MIRTFTAAEVASIYRVPLGTVYRLASTEKWRRTNDGKWPVLYSGDDVEGTMDRIISELRAEVARLTLERNGYRDEVNQLRKVVSAAMTWRSTRRILAGMGKPKYLRESVDAADRHLSDAVDAFVPPWETKAVPGFDPQYQSGTRVGEAVRRAAQGSPEIAT